MQYHKLLLDRVLTGATANVPTSLGQFGEYLVYTDSLGGGAVNEFNVRFFLNDSRNQVIINDFIAYLNANTTSEEFLQIVASNQQLSEVFNEFYQTTVMNGIPTPSSAVTEQTSQSIIVNYNETQHLWNGTSTPFDLLNLPLSIDGASRSNAPLSVSSKFVYEDGYYIPVFIELKYQEMSKDAYDGCEKKVNLLLDPDSFPSQTTVIEGEVHEVMSVKSSDGSLSNVTFNLSEFERVSHQLIKRCYDSDKVDNRYCDLLYFANKKVVEFNMINVDYISSTLQSENRNLAAEDVIQLLVNVVKTMGANVSNDLFDPIIE